MNSIEEENHNIVIVGGGICGLATALALHKKGIKSIVLEKSDRLRAWGAAIGIFTNGWRALDELGVAAELRQKAVRLQELREEFVGNKTQVTPYGEVELRCLKRSDLIEVLASELPSETMHFGCQIEAIKVDPITCFPILHLNDGRTIKTKILIGCDGSNSVVAKSLRLKEPKVLPLFVIRGFTNYSQGHSWGAKFLRIRRGSNVLGIITIDQNLVHWFVGKVNPPKDEHFQKDSHHIKELAVHLLKEFPDCMIDMVKQCDDDSLSLTYVRYRAPWHLWTADFRKNTITVAGDAMHVMGPFLGQGGAAGLEDAIVLARCLAQEIPSGFEDTVSNKELRKRVGTAFTNYVKERRMRILSLTTKSYLTGRLITASSKLMKLVFLVLLIFFFQGFKLNHVKYDCGTL